MSKQSASESQQEYSSKEKSLLENDFADPCPNCGAVLFEWEDTCDECDGNEETETEQTTLLTDGGQSTDGTEQWDPKKDPFACSCCGGYLPELSRVAGVEVCEDCRAEVAR